MKCTDSAIPCALAVHDNAVRLIVAMAAWDVIARVAMQMTA